MKSYGICSKQSARKHRRQRDHVVRHHNGLYVWGHTTHHMVLAIWECEFLYGTNPGAKLTIAKSKRQQDGWSDSSELPTGGHDALSAALRLPREYVAAPSDTQVSHFQLEGRPMLRIGEMYWPKRRNQHTRPIRICSITPGGVIRYDRAHDEPVAGQWAEYDVFCGLIGKRCD